MQNLVKRKSATLRAIAETKGESLLIFSPSEEMPDPQRHGSVRPRCGSTGHAIGCTTLGTDLRQEGGNISGLFRPSMEKYLGSTEFFVRNIWQTKACGDRR
jgi:hypothetical protein